MPGVPRPPVRLQSYALAFVSIAVFLILAHGELLRLPFYWDEIGQFVPAALDILRTGSWIPVSTVPNVHPPGMMAFLALVWKLFGYSIPATRVAMLLIAALGALVTFLLAIELTRGAKGMPAFAALALLCFSPLYFAQSMLAQLDMPAMCLSILALLLFLQDRVSASAIACTALVLVKETGVVTPALFAAWLLFEGPDLRDRARALWFLPPLPVLILWLVALHHATGYWFGNAAFTTYNVREPLHAIPFLLALARRGYFLFIGAGHLIGTLVLVWALRRMPLLRERPWRIAGSFVLAQLLIVSALGGAVLERYILPALPVVYIAFAVSLGALPARLRPWTLGGLILCLTAANFINPPYPFPFENNLAFTSFVELEENAASGVEPRSAALPGGGVVVTTFPVADALRNPDFGFVRTPHRIVEIPVFSRSEVEKLRVPGPDIVVVYRRTWDPLHLLDKPAIAGFMEQHFGFVPELTTDQTAELLSMHVARRWTRRGLSMDLLERFPRADAARANVTNNPE